MKINLGIFLQKLVESLAALLLLAMLTFFLLKVLPGGPFDSDVALNPAVKQKLMEHWQLNASWFVQARSYIVAVLHGDFGVSMARPDSPVSEIIFRGLSNTLMLNGLALILIIGGAFVITIIAVKFQNSWIEGLVEQGMITLLSLPSLFWGPLLIYLFGFYWNLLPVALLTSPTHYILPLLTLILRPLASLVRLLKNSLQDNYREEYVRTAHAKGAGEWRILFKHVLRNSLMAFMSYLGPLIVGLFSGSFLVEVLYAIPGLGSEFVAALNDRDYTLIMGLTLFYGFLLITLNSFIDVLAKIIDPRLREKA